MTQQCALWLVSLCAVVLIVAATVNLWGPSVATATEGTEGFRAVMWIASIDEGMQYLLMKKYAAFGRSIYYGAFRPVDWHLAVVAMLLYGRRAMCGRAWAGAGLILMHPFVARRIKITITNSTVVIHGRLLRRKFPRGDNTTEAIKFRVVEPESHFASLTQDRVRDDPLLSPLARVPPAIVEMNCGFARYPLIFARRRDRAEAIVARCHEAMLQTQHQLTSIY